MNKLTDQEIELYIKLENKNTGADEISRKYLESLNLDDIREIKKVGDLITDIEGRQLYKLDRFTPRAGSYAFKPSFAGRQVLMGREGRKLHFSNGVWFC